MVDTIEEYVGERNIQYLLHFTRESNLDRIVHQGLLTRDVLTLEGYRNFNDGLRLDETNAVCVSIGFPNYKMFYSIRKENADESWVVIAIHPAALWMLPCAFCITNAASASVTEIPIEERRGLSALQCLYDDWGDKTRELLQLPNQYPTNPQAEVLMLDGVPRQYIFGIIAQNTAKKLEFETRFPNLKVVSYPGFYGARVDYRHWR